MRVLFISLCIVTIIQPVISAQSLETNELTLAQAIARALQMSPSLAAAVHAVAAAEARVMQANLFPNPEFALEIENFGGSGDLNGFNAAESTAVISQPVLLGGKRGRRRAVAESEQRLAGRDLDLCLVHSSLAAVMGVLDGVAYTAAHLFMDEFVWARQRSSSLPWTWPSYRSTSSWSRVARRP